MLCIICHNHLYRCEHFTIKLNWCVRTPNNYYVYKLGTIRCVHKVFSFNQTTIKSKQRLVVEGHAGIILNIKLNYMSLWIRRIKQNEIIVSLIHLMQAYFEPVATQYGYDRTAIYESRPRMYSKSFEHSPQFLWYSLLDVKFIGG